MSQTISGTYKNGTVSLDRLPEGVTEARVVVDFVDEPEEKRQRGTLRFGMFAKPEHLFTKDEDIEAVTRSWNHRDEE
jgi:hypothetical protein